MSPQTHVINFRTKSLCDVEFPSLYKRNKQSQNVGNAEQIIPKLKTWLTKQLMIAEHKLH